MVDSQSLAAILLGGRGAMGAYSCVHVRLESVELQVTAEVSMRHQPHPKCHSI